MYFAKSKEAVGRHWLGEDAMIQVVFRALGRALAAAALLLLAVAGCGGGPSRVDAAALDPDAAAEAAMEQLDTDGDGVIGGGELAAAAGLGMVAEQGVLDVDKDGRVSPEEIAARVEAWQAQEAGLIAVRCHVRLNGQPVPGATVTFEPMPFLGNELKVAEGVTNPFGRASVSIPKASRPTSETPPGVQLGLYHVRISKLEQGQELLPARYNTESILGQEVSYDDPRMANNRVIFELEN